MTDWFRENAGGFTGELHFDEPLSRHTYYRIGGPATVLAIPKSIEDLGWLARGINAGINQKVGPTFFVLGLGSNILASDRGFAGLVIKPSRINLQIEHEDRRLTTGGSVAISSLLRRCAQEGWGGLEFLTGVPGSVGGAVVMNAGTHLGETKDRLEMLQVFDFKKNALVEISKERFRYEYRKNRFLPDPCIVWSANWRIESEAPAEVKRRIDETLARRKATQPIDFPSCGSVFKNPRVQGLHAWQVLDKLGLRGHRIGDAQISEKHSNFIINLGAAKAPDVRGLIELAKKRALDELGIGLEEEVMYLGEF